MIDTTYIRSSTTTRLVAHYNGAKNLPDSINQDFPSPGWKIAINSLTTSALAAPSVFFISPLYTLATNDLKKGKRQLKPIKTILITTARRE